MTVLVTLNTRMYNSENNQAKIKKFEVLFSDYYQDSVNGKLTILQTIF